MIVFDVCFFISNFIQSSTVYAASLCTFVRFEKLSDLVSGLIEAYRTLIERKRSEEYLVINLAVERKLWVILIIII